MQPKSRPVLTGLVIVGITSMLMLQVYLTFFLPRTLDAWAQQGRQLTPAERVFAQGANMSRRYWIPIFAVVGFTLAGCLIWLGRDGNSKE